MIDAVPSRCFQGVVPSAIATVAPDGTPNVTFLSQVYRVDERHVALSCQFFNKTKRNVIDNPQATVVLYDPVTFEAYHLDLSYRHAEESGPLFDEMAMRIEAIASHTGMSGVFKLLSADVYEVERCEKVDGFIEVPDLPPLDDPGGRSELRTLQVVSQRACRATTLDDLFREVLASLDETLGFGHGMVLLPSGDKLRVEACRGYPEHVVGLEIEVGDGFIGAVAHQRRVMRVGGIKEDLRYGRAVRGRLAERGAAGALCREVPLLGLPDAQSALALPLEVGQRLVGVLALESRERLRFDDGDEAFLAVVANQVAACLDSLLLRSGPSPAGEPRRFRFFPQDDCVFVDDEYLIRNVPGRILWKLLRAHRDTGRTEFSNRELRLDPWLGLPKVRDNLESRLALLRKRLALKCPEIELPSTSRGHFELRVSCPIELSEDGLAAP